MPRFRSLMPVAICAAITISPALLLLSAPPAGAEPPSSMTVAYAAQECDMCDECFTTGEHWAEPHENANRAGEAHDCQSEGSCAIDHPHTCSPTVDFGRLIERARIAALSGGPSSFDALSNDFPNQVKFNDERYALQVFGCDQQSVIAHFPLAGSRVTVEDSHR